MKRLPIISADDMESILRHLGFQRKRQVGSHVLFLHPDGRVTVVPFHKGEVKNTLDWGNMCHRETLNIIVPTLAIMIMEIQAETIHTELFTLPHFSDALFSSRLQHPAFFPPARKRFESRNNPNGSSMDCLLGLGE